MQLRWTTATVVAALLAIVSLAVIDATMVRAQMAAAESDSERATRQYLVGVTGMT